MTNFVKIQSGNFEALIRPANLAKREAALAKVKPGFKPAASKELARTYPQYKPGMSTAEYVRVFEKANALCYPQHMGMESPYSAAGSHPLNCQPAAQYDPNVPLYVEDANPDYIPGLDDVPAKPKRTRKAAKPAPDKAAVMWVLIDAGLTYYQANPAADKLIALFEGTK